MFTTRKLHLMVFFFFFLQSMFAQQKSTFRDEVLDDLFLYFVSLINKLKQHSNTLREKKTLKKKSVVGLSQSLWLPSFFWQSSPRCSSQQFPHNFSLLWHAHYFVPRCVKPLVVFLITPEGAAVTALPRATTTAALSLRTLYGHTHPWPHDEFMAADDDDDGCDRAKATAITERW